MTSDSEEKIILPKRTVDELSKTARILRMAVDADAPKSEHVTVDVRKPAMSQSERRRFFSVCWTILTLVQVLMLPAFLLGASLPALLLILLGTMIGIKMGLAAGAIRSPKLNMTEKVCSVLLVVFLITTWSTILISASTALAKGQQPVLGAGAR